MSTIDPAEIAGPLHRRPVACPTVKPMLATAVDNATMMELASNDDWWFSPKLDGVRKLVEVNHGKVTTWGRDGQVTSLPQVIAQRLSSDLQGGRFILDGELMATKPFVTYAVFDVIEVEGLTDASWAYEKRLLALRELGRLAKWSGTVQVLDVAETTEAKINMFKRVSDANGEGLILRRRLARYKYGRSRDMFKFKFRKTLDAFVVRLGDEGKDNIVIAVYDGAGDVCELGPVSALTGDGPSVKVGDVVTVTYLGSYDGGKLIQPVKPLIRSDKTPEECLLDQLQILDRTAILEEK